MTGMSLVGGLWRPAGRLGRAGRGEIGWGDLALAGFLSSYIALITSGLLPASMTANPGARPVAARAALAMTVPVAWERRAPLAAAAAVAVAAVLNEYAIGPMVRCGPALVAVLTIAFFPGARLPAPGRAAAAAACAVSVPVQSVYDPHLQPSFLFFGL